MSSAENDTRPGRFVMLDREEVAWVCKRIADLSVLQTEERAIGEGIIDKIKAAPADPAEAVTQAIYSTPGWYEADMIAPVVLRALGAPKATP